MRHLVGIESAVTQTTVSICQTPGTDSRVHFRKQIGPQRPDLPGGKENTALCLTSSATKRYIQVPPPFRHASHREKCKAGERKAPYPAKQSVLRSETSFSTITKNNAFRKVASTSFTHSFITSESSYLAIADVSVPNLTCEPQSRALQHQWKPQKYDYWDKRFPNYSISEEGRTFISEAGSC